MQKNFFFILQIDPPILETVNADSSDQEMAERMELQQPSEQYNLHVSYPNNASSLEIIQNV